MINNFFGQLVVFFVGAAAFWLALWLLGFIVEFIPAIFGF
jgi:hypothetical protein